MFKLHKYITGDNVNHIEIHLVKSQLISDDVIDLNIDDSLVEEVKSKYKNWKTAKYMAYSRNHIIYLYNLNDDNQIVFSKIANLPSEAYKSWYIVPSTYSKLPTHIFPCVNDIDENIEYIITEAKITNRISLIIRKDQYGTYLYIEYKHSPNVDIDKSESIINEVMQNIYKI